MVRSLRLGIALAAAAVSVSGCYAQAEPVAPVGTVELSSAPVDIEAYPHTVYDGRTVYYYGNGWYYRDAGRWHRYREEPGELRTYRQRHYVQQAPPAPHYYPSTGYPAPGAYPPGYQAPPATAPPAVRTQ